MLTNLLIIFFIIYFKIAKGDVQHRGKFAYLPCLTYDGYPSKIPVAIPPFINDNQRLKFNGNNINPLPEPLPLNDRMNSYLEINPNNIDGVLPGVKCVYCMKLIKSII